MVCVLIAVQGAGGGRLVGAFMCWTTCSLGYDKHTFDHVVHLAKLAVCSQHLMCVLSYPQVCPCPDMHPDPLFSLLPSTFEF